MENTEQYLRHLLQSAVWTTEDKDWLKSYLEGDMAELKAIALKEYEDDLESLTVLLDSRVSETLLESLHERLQIGKAPKRVRLWPRIAAVAAAVAMVVFGVWFFNYQDTPEASSGQVLDDKSVVQNDVAPGKNGATITLASGKVIQLSDAKSGVVIGDDKLAYNDGTEIAASQNAPRNDGLGGEDAVAKTAKGQTYIFTLPDGTKVWLNAASSLTIPSDFSGTETRKVELTGEAYFEVTKNKKRPFIVESNGQQVEVLGTHFNINTFEQLHMGSGARTTLLEGSVKVTAYGKSMVLQPGRMAYNSPDGLRVLEADVEQAVAWKNGYFSFKDESIQNIMQIISRWYDIEVSYQGNVTKDGFNGKISRFKNISQVLKMLEDTKLVHFKVEGRRVTVKE